MLSFPKGGLKGSAADIVEYLEARALERGQGYYSHGAAPSHWGGTLAAEWGLRGPVDAKIFKDLLEGLAPDGERFAEAGPDRRMGKDLTSNAPKSCSIAMVAGDEKLRQIILEGHRRANQRMMEWVEKEYVTARYGKGGKEVEHTGAAIWATYQHEDARTAGEPSAAMHLHNHNILLNVTQGRDGKLRALDIDFGVDGVHLAGAVYQAEYAAYLREQGVALRACDNGGGGWELAAITDEQIRECSPRSAQIEAELARRGLDRASATATQKSAANQATRGSKTQLSQDEQRWEWRALCRRIGVDLTYVFREPGVAADREARTAADALAYATDHLSERESVINGQSTRLHALRAGVLDGVTIDTLNTEIATARASGNLIDAGAGRLVTRETLEREASILHTISTAPPVAPLATPEAALARIAAREASQGFAFLPGQRNAITTSICATVQYSGIVGAAGAGKTTAIAAIVDEARAQGLTVVGLGPSQTAADGLRDAGADECRTLASFVLRDADPDAGPRLIVLDEAGMVSARDMQSFLEKVGPDDRVLFVGDPKQLAAVEAGSPFAQMMSEGALQYSTIDEITRQKDVGLLAVAQAFADGRNAEAVRLAEPYMTTVAATEEDYTAADAAPEPPAPPELIEGEATGGMLGYVASLMKKDKDKLLTAPASNDFKTVREWLDAHSDSELGYEALEKTGKGKLAPVAVRSQAIARTTADAYLKLSPEERAKTLVMAATHDVRRAINARIREGLQKDGQTDSVTVTALDKSTLTRAQLRQAVHYKAGQVLRVPEGRGKSRKVVDWTVSSTDPTRNTITCKNSEGTEKVFHPKDLDPKRVALYSPRALDLSPGDRILFTENNRNAGFQNNETGTVVVAENGKVEIQKDNGQTVTIDPTKTHTLDHGWAVTVHRSQGRTIDRAFVAGMASKVATAALAYVACTRERWHLQIFTDNIKKLQQAWAKVAERQTAMDATRAAQGQEPDALQKARDAVRSQVQEQQQQQEIQEVEKNQEPTPKPAQRPGRGREMDMDLEM